MEDIKELPHPTTTLVNLNQTALPFVSMAHIHKSTRKLGHVKLDMAQFDPSLLSEEATLEVALSNLQGHLLNSVDDQSALVALLMATPNLFEFVISSKYSSISAA